MDVRLNVLPLATLLLVVACDQRSDDATSAPPVNAKAKQPADKCTPPAVATPDGDKTLESALLEETKANFDAAFKASCSKGLLKGKSLFDAKAADQGRLFLINAPDANLASIYLSQVDGNRMVLEYPFLTTDGVSHVPTATELEDTIYCAVVGATPEEQESTGRCLVD